MHAVLVVESDSARRLLLRNAFSERDILTYEVNDPFEGMSALGRADFSAVVFAVGVRQLALRGFCQLAKKRHPHILLLALQHPEDAPFDPTGFGVEIELFPPGTTNAAIAERVAAQDMPLNYLNEAPTARIHIPGLVDQEEAAFAASAEPIVPLAPDEPTAPYTVAPGPSTLPTAEPAASSSSSDEAARVPAAVRFDAPVPHTPMPGPQVLEPKTLPAYRLPSSSSSGSSDGPGTGPRPEDVDTAVDVDILWAAGSAPLEPLFEGDLADGGPALIMSIASQELTGRLVVSDGPGAGELVVFGGDPVWVHYDDGPAGMLRDLKRLGHAPVHFAYDPAEHPDLFAALIAAGHATGQELHAFMRNAIRDRIHALIKQSDGAYAFFEDATYLDTLPLVRVNAFGLLLNERRAQTPPTELLRRHQDMEWTYVHPTAGLGPASLRLRPFVRGNDLATLITGQKRVKTTLGDLGFDPLMGTLLILTLVDGGLVTLHDDPRESFDTVELSEATQVSPGTGRFTVPSSEIEDADSEEEQRARDEIFNLYMRLKPLTDPAAVLGVSAQADNAVLEAAYRERMRSLDPAQVPEGSARQLMVARIDELRDKITRAFELLKKS